MVVLVAVDGERGTDPILESGASLAERLGAELAVLHVMPQARYDAEQRSRAGGGARPLNRVVYPVQSGVEADRARETNPYPIDAAQQDATAVARTIVEETLGDRDGASVQGRVGDPVDQILREAERRDAGHLVIGGRKRTAVGKAVFGSVTQSVLQQADCPVVTVPADELASERPGPVVAAVDRSARAARVVTEANRLAAAADRPLHVAYVAPETDPGQLLDAAAAPSDDDLRTAAAGVAAEAAEGRADSFTSVGLVGEPSRELLEYAAAEDAAYLVTAGRRRSPLGKVLFGSVTQSILLGADRPVLTVLVDD